MQADTRNTIIVMGLLAVVAVANLFVSRADIEIVFGVDEICATDGIECFFYTWQTILTGAIAIAIAWVTVSRMQNQLKIMGEQHAAETEKMTDETAGRLKVEMSALHDVTEVAMQALRIKQSFNTATAGSFEIELEEFSSVFKAARKTWNRAPAPLSTEKTLFETRANVEKAFNKTSGAGTMAEMIIGTAIRMTEDKSVPISEIFKPSSGQNQEVFDRLFQGINELSSAAARHKKELRKQRRQLLGIED